MTDKLRINSKEFSWNSCEFKLLAVPYEGILSIDFGQKRERKKVAGMNRSGRPIARTRGKYEPHAVKIRYLASTFERIKIQTAPLGLGSYGDAEVTATLSIFEVGIPPRITVFDRMVVADESEAYSDDGEALGVDVEYDVMSILTNGIPLFSLGVV